LNAISKSRFARLPKGLRLRNERAGADRSVREGRGGESAFEGA